MVTHNTALSLGAGRSCRHAHTMSLSRNRLSRETSGMRYQRRCIGGVRGAVPGAQQLTGGAGPAHRTGPVPRRRRAQPVRAPHPSRLRSPPLIHYLRTADRFQARSFCPPLHDDRSNLMPFLCPASNVIRLRSTSVGSPYSSLVANADGDPIINGCVIVVKLSRCTDVQRAC